MQNVSIQKASELPPRVKSAVEQLLGRPIGADEEISVVAVPPQQVPPSENRAEVAQSLEAFLNRRAEKTRDISQQEIDAAVDEAVDRVRHSRG
jgi:predicted metal-dependent hydrolase